MQENHFFPSYCFSCSVFCHHSFGAATVQRRQQLAGQRQLHDSVPFHVHPSFPRLCQGKQQFHSLACRSVVFTRRCSRCRLQVHRMSKLWPNCHCSLHGMITITSQCFLVVYISCTLSTLPVVFEASHPIHPIPCLLTPIPLNCYPR